MKKSVKALNAELDNAIKADILKYPNRTTAIIESLIEDIFFKMEYWDSKFEKAQNEGNSLLANAAREQLQIANAQLADLRELHNAALFVQSNIKPYVDNAGDTFLKFFLDDIS